MELEIFPALVFPYSRKNIYTNFLILETSLKTQVFKI